MSDAPREQLIILESRLADSALAELRTLASVTQVLPPRLALVRSDRATTARIAQIPGVLAVHDQTLGVVPPDLTAAERTFVDRAGVCRDFTHLGITLSRALGIPARAVSAYALQLAPPDFHAIFEVFLENNWWLIDPTRLAPIEGIVRIGSGRDASDIAFLTSDKQCQVLRQTIAVSSVR